MLRRPPCYVLDARAELSRPLRPVDDQLVSRRWAADVRELVGSEGDACVRAGLDLEDDVGAVDEADARVGVVVERPAVREDLVYSKGM